MPAKKAGGVRDASQESRVHVETFSACIRLFLCPAEASGRQGRGRIAYAPHTRPDIWGEYVFLVFKHRFMIIQTRFKRHSNSALRAVGEGVCDTPLLRYAHHVPGFLGWRP